MAVGFEHISFEASSFLKSYLQFAFKLLMSSCLNYKFTGSALYDIFQTCTARSDKNPSSQLFSRKVPQKEMQGFSSRF